MTTELKFKENFPQCQEVCPFRPTLWSMYSNPDKGNHRGQRDGRRIDFKERKKLIPKTRLKYFISFFFYFSDATFAHTYTRALYLHLTYDDSARCLSLCLFGSVKDNSKNKVLKTSILSGSHFKSSLSTQRIIPLCLI